MGWGQKTFEPSPGRKFTRDSLILFTSSVLTEHGGETSPRFAEHFTNNTVVFSAGKAANYGTVDAASQLTEGLLVLGDNKFFTSPGQEMSLKVGNNGSMTLAQLQHAGTEVGSTLTASIPSDAELVAIAKRMLLMP
jgi:hypothetical protein